MYNTEKHWGCYNCNIGDTTHDSLVPDNDGIKCCPQCHENVTVYYCGNFSIEDCNVKLLSDATKQEKISPKGLDRRNKI
jgi:hypothetical protein